MSNLTENLREWRKDRNIKTPNTKVLVANVIEELLEMFYKNKETIQNIQTSIMSAYFDKEPISEENTIDCLQDGQVFFINETELMGYDNIKCNNEVFKHISCRNQDPIQKEQWAKFGTYGKWLKDPNQNPNEIYEPNYETCKIKEVVQDKDIPDYFKCKKVN